MRTFATILIISVAACSAVSCSGLRHAAKAEEPVGLSCETDYSPLTPDSFTVRINAEVPQQYRNPNTGIVIVPVLRGADSTQVLPLGQTVAEGLLHNTFNARKSTYEPDLQDSIAFRSRYLPEGASEISSETGVAIEDWMKDSRVDVDVYADAYLKRVHLGSASFPVRIEDINDYADLDFLEKYYYTEPVAQPQPEDLSPAIDEGIRFSLDSFKIDDAETASALKAYAEKVLSSYRLDGYTVNVTVSNSPEGSLEHNRRLGQNRLASAMKMLAAAGVDTLRCSVNMIDENWDGVCAAVAEGFPEVKDSILSLIVREEDPDVREARLRDEYYAVWRQLRRETYPDLRFCSIEILGQLRPQSFSPEEKASAADVSSMNEEMLDLVRSGEYEAAFAIADRIPNDGLDQRIMSNKAMLYLKAGRQEEAEALLKRCPDITEAGYNLAVLYIISRQYSLAEPLLEENDCIDKAVVKIALGKKQEARDVLLMLGDSPQREKLLEMTE